VLIDRKIKKFSSLDVHEELLKLDIDFTAPKNSSLQTLKLEWFDDNSFEARLPED